MLKENVAFIGLGACGGNIALGFQKKNYHTLFINGSEQDNQSLQGARNVLRLEGFDGCGGNRKNAELALANNLDVLEEIKKIKEDIIFLVFSTGGSTGSGIAPIMCDLLLELNEDGSFQKTVCCIAVLPKRTEALQKHINAYQCIQELSEKTEIGSCILIDNNKMDDVMKINAVIINLLDLFLTDESYSKRGNVDKSERLTMLEQRGALLLSKVCTSKATDLEILESLFTKSIFAPIEPDGVVEHIAVINSTEEGISVEPIKKAVGIPQNVFIGYGAKKTITVLSGLSFPITYLREIKENAEISYRERLKSRSSIGQLQELNLEFAVSTPNCNSSVQKKVSRLELLRQLKFK